MCLFLKRWRKITKGGDTNTKSTELCDELCNDFFERVLAAEVTDALKEPKRRQ